MNEPVFTTEPGEANDQLLQFNLSLLFSLITLGTFVAAMIALLVRDAENISFAGTVFYPGLQGTGMAGYCSWAIKKKKQMLSECGRRLG